MAMKLFKMPCRNLWGNLQFHQNTLAHISSIRGNSFLNANLFMQRNTNGYSDLLRTQNQRQRFVMSCNKKFSACDGIANSDGKNVMKIQTGDQNTNSISRRRKCNVAVIGAGAAGLVAARELTREGHEVVVFEQSHNIGGVWNFSNEKEKDLLGSETDARVHWSMYKDLRTNLPREVMGYSDFPFDSEFDGSIDPRRFPLHTEVLAYLKAFALKFDLTKYIRYGKKVNLVEPLVTNDGEQRFLWKIKCTDSNEAVHDCAFDAVVICNGHYSEPRIATKPGMDEFPGLMMHSHNYREPKPFKGKRVVIIGASNSGTDIALEIQDIGAAAVYLSSRNWQDAEGGTTLPKDDKSSNGLNGKCEIVKVNDVERFDAEGNVYFGKNDKTEQIDVVIYATGYHYSFPFLQKGDGIPSLTEDGRVGPLYQHVFPCSSYAPSLSFVGLLWKVVPFPQFELQSRWIARCLSGRSELPSPLEMMKDTQNYYKELENEGIHPRYTHRMGMDSQRKYNTWLAQQCGSDSEWPSWRDMLYNSCGLSKRAFRLDYRERELIDAQEALNTFKNEKKELEKSLKVGL